MRLKIALLGTEIFLIELTRQDPAELLADAITQLDTPDDTDTPGNQFGVSGCHLERSPETEYWGEDKTFGFHGGDT